MKLYVFVVIATISVLFMSTQPAESCICHALYSPVCGSNGVTYSNDCIRKCAGQRLACRSSCPCRKVPTPIYV
ncbi:hypothetical protein CHUAL_002173 [Chamberlinius hualienensis]